MPYTKFFIILFKLLVKPFTNRVKLGEGGLLLLNFTHSVACHRQYKLVMIETLLSFLVLCILYGYNDYTDAEKDKSNPKKDHAFINMILENHRLFVAFIITIQILTLAVAMVFLGRQIAVYIAILYGVNFLYSQRVKSMPLADIMIVSIWGGLYVCISGSFVWVICLAAGLMVGIAHFFQVVTDKDSDQKNNISTSAVVLAGWENLLLFTLCLALAAVLYVDTGDLIMTLISFLPFVFYFSDKRVTFSWYASRFVFFILWLLILKSVYGGI
jgi:4-hydroxybenzoate polyprenyltransferase